MAWILNMIINSETVIVNVSTFHRFHIAFGTSLPHFVVNNMFISSETFDIYTESEIRCIVEEKKFLCVEPQLIPARNTLSSITCLFST